MGIKPLPRQKSFNAANPGAILKPESIALLGERPSLAEISRFQALPLNIRLRREGIYHFDEIIHLQPKEWLIKNFGPGRDYPVNVSKLMKNIIWQTRTRIVNKEDPPISGLVRSFWYTHIKPALARADSLSSDTDQYIQMIKTFVRLVQYCDFIRYSEFGFVDDNQNDRQIGVYDYIILFAEKAGHYPLLQDIARETEVTILSLGGQPSQLSAEYFVDEMKSKGIDIRKSFYTFSLVDYDTSGWIIRDAFLSDLNFYGLKHIQHQDIILPVMFSQEEIELFKFPIPSPSGMVAKNKKWLKESGGINGKLYGLEADAAPAPRIKDIFREHIKDLTESSPSARKGRALLSLHNSLQEYILAKLQI